MRLSQNYQKLHIAPFILRGRMIVIHLSLAPMFSGLHVPDRPPVSLENRFNCHFNDLVYGCSTKKSHSKNHKILRDTGMRCDFSASWSCISRFKCTYYRRISGWSVQGIKVKKILYCFEEAIPIACSLKMMVLFPETKYSRFIKNRAVVDLRQGLYFEAISSCCHQFYQHTRYQWIWNVVWLTKWG